jgi:preprotein translocase subunit SecA
MNVQRMVIYEQRRRVLDGADLSEEIEGWMDDLVANIVYEHTESEYHEEWDLESLFTEMQTLYDTEISADEITSSMSREELIEEFQEDARDAYAAKVEEYGPELMREVERYLVLQVVDVRWREHLESMEYLRDGIHLRAMAQKDPLSEYRAEGHSMFEELTATIQEEIVRYLLRIQIERPPEQGELVHADAGANGDGLSYEHESMAGSEAIRAAGAGEEAPARQARAGATAGAAGAAATTVSTGQRVVAEQVGRNDPCPCGSGKKYKKCHGA